jgi:hypothetical protein
MKGVIEFEFDEYLENEFAEEYLQVITKMLYMFHFVASVDTTKLVDEKEYLVDYVEKYCKTVKANNPEEARKKVLEERQGETLYFETNLHRIEEGD